MVVKAVKCNGSGNNFVLLDLISCNENITANVLLQIFDCFKANEPLDGILIVARSDAADVFMSVCNPDGNRTPMCINGIRCVGKYLFDTSLQSNDFVSVETETGVFKLERDESNGIISFIKVNGIHPISVLSSYTHISGFSSTYPFIRMEVFTPYIVHKTNLIHENELIKLGITANSNDSIFPIGMNVSMVKILNDTSLYVRTYERGGIGMSDSCASSIVASTYAISEMGYLDFERDINVYSRGGLFKCTCSQKSQSANLTGAVLFEYMFSLHINDSIKIVDIIMEDATVKNAYDSWVKKSRIESEEASYVF